MIALCLKCYFIKELEGEKKKFSTKGMSKKQNEITARWQRFKSALDDGSKDMATNRGFRMRGGRIVTHEQQKLGLSSYYDNNGCYPAGCTPNQSNFTFSQRWLEGERYRVG